MSFIDQLLWPAAATADSSTTTNNTFPIAATSVVATVAALSVLRRALWPVHPKTIPSPLHTVIPKLSKAELDRLEYKPDAFPGARDVETPYGSIRVYEWGPESGEKVLFVHGITTSCQSLGPLAHALVNEKGCRVMLFDLFGRGFSDGVGDLPHDARLYTTQILLALASSPLAWTGTNGFNLIGYSLGGGISVHFAAAFPHLVSHLVLLAPAGLIRVETFGVVNRFIFTAGLVPERLLAFLTKKKLQKPIAANTRRAPSPPQPSTPTEEHPQHRITNDPIAASLTEAADPLPSDPTARLVPLNTQVLSYVRWMLNHHEGFIPAFMSCIRDAPLINQHKAWAKLAERKPKTTSVVIARADEIIDPKEFEQDALPLIGGRENVNWVVLGGGHDFVMTHTGDVFKALERFLDL
ncbi:Alpha/Beta hydrolase fold [Naviculisporaceae sp. PSN 640]